MANINLRNVDNKLKASLKSEAPLAGMGLEKYCVFILEQRKKVDNGQETPQEVRTATKKTGKTRKANTEVEKETAEVEQEVSKNVASDGGEQGITRMINSPEDVAKNLPAVTSVNRPAHAAGCKCAICKPSKDS